MNIQRIKRIESLLPLLKYLGYSDKPILIKKIAEKYNTNERTIRRDINELVSCNIFVKSYRSKLLYLEPTGKYWSPNTTKIEDNKNTDVRQVEKEIDTIEIKNTSICSFNQTKYDQTLINKALNNKRIKSIPVSKLNIDIVLYIYIVYIKANKNINNITGLYRTLKSKNYVITDDILYHFRKPTPCKAIQEIDKIRKEYEESKNLSAKNENLTAKNTNFALDDVRNCDAHSNNFIPTSNKLYKLVNKQHTSTPFDDFITTQGDELSLKREKLLKKHASLAVLTQN